MPVFKIKIKHVYYKYSMQYYVFLLDKILLSEHK